jgi:uncharacterized protein YkwD
MAHGMRWMVIVGLFVGCGGSELEEGEIESSVGTPIALVNGTAVTGLAAARAEERHYFLDVPAGASGLAFSIDGPRGDADLYVRFGAQPTKTVYDFRPFKSGSRETVTPPAATAGRWFIMVRAYSAYGDLALTGRFLAFAPPPAPNSTRLENGAALSASASRGVEQRFHIDVPEGATQLRFAMSGGRGDGDLYVKLGAPPTTSVWDFRPYRSNSNETVTPPASTAGTWHIMIRAYSDFTDVLFEVGFTWSEPARRTLEDRVLELSNQHRAAGATCGGTAFGPAPPLSMNETVRTAARLHSADMAARAYFDHTTPDGVTFDARMRNAGYQGPSPWGENIAAGQRTPEEVVAGWMMSPHHCEGIMNPSFRVVGVGYGYAAGSPNRHYWTQDFGGG